MSAWLVVGGLLAAAAAGDYALSRTRFGGRLFRLGQDVGHAVRRLFTRR